MDDEAARVRGYVEANGVRTYYEALGSGDPLVLLHGGLCAIETFGGLAEHLARRYRVYLPERRGHGRTPDLPGPFTYDVMAQDTIAFLNALGLPSAHLVGWSDGAIVALLIALRRPALVRRLVMIGQHINPQGLRPEAAEVLNRRFPDVLPPILRDLYGAASPDGPEHWDVVLDKEWQMIKTEPDIALSVLEKISAPTLVMLGDRDVVTPEHAEAMRRALPDGQLEVVPAATHFLPMEKPDVVAHSVLDFLGKV